MGTKMNVGLLESFFYLERACHPSWVKLPVLLALCKVHYVSQEVDTLLWCKARFVPCALNSAVLLALSLSGLCTALYAVTDENKLCSLAHFA